MIYSNVEKNAEKREFEFGVIHQIALGEVGRGRKIMTLTCPENTVVKKGENPELTIGLTKSGKPRVEHNTEDKTLYMVLSTEGRYVRGCVGNVSVTNPDSVEVMNSGWGAFGEAGRIGTWDVFTLKVTGETWMRIKRTRLEPDFAFIREGKVNWFSSFDDAQIWADINGIDIKFDEACVGFTRINTKK